MNQIGTLQMRQELQDRRDELAVKARTWLRHRGQPAGPKDVEAFLDRVASSDGPRLAMNKAVRVQVSIGHALYTLTPMLLERHLRILRFDKPSLVVSDAPVGTWAPGQDRAVGVGNAALVFLPLSRQVALAYGAKVRAVDSVAGPRRAAQINFLAADGAVRWVYEHPDDRTVEALDIPVERPKWVTEFVAELDQAERFRRELWQHVRRLTVPGKPADAGRAPCRAPRRPPPRTAARATRAPARPAQHRLARPARQDQADSPLPRPCARASRSR